MRFSVITPTLQRLSLLKTCESIRMQTHEDWEHLIVIDGVGLEPETVDVLLHPKERMIYPCRHFGNVGNTPRHIAWWWTQGDYIIYLDDDNYFAHPDALRQIAQALRDKNEPPFAVAPITRFGERFLCYPPGNCRTDSANMIIHRDIAQWPNVNDYTADGMLAERLHEQYGSVVLEIDPIIVVPIQGKGIK